MHHTSAMLRHTHDGTVLEGLLLVPQTPQAAVLLVHEFMGPGEYMHRHAERLAAEGFVVFACDLYGQDIRPATPAEASAVSHIYRDDRLRMRRRVRAAFDALASHPTARSLPLCSLGFSFGGGAVLELARSGAPVAATCSVYGYLSTSHPLTAESAGTLPCGPILALHGAHDTVVPLSDLAPFVTEMRDAGLDARTLIYADAGHGFCNELLVRDDAHNSWYCPTVATRAWQDILTFFRNALGQTPTPPASPHGASR